MTKELELHPDILVRLADVLHESKVDRDMEVEDFILAQYLYDCLVTLYNTIERHSCDKASRGY